MSLIRILLCRWVVRWVSDPDVGTAINRRADSWDNMVINRDSGEKLWSVCLINYLESDVAFSSTNKIKCSYVRSKNVSRQWCWKRNHSEEVSVRLAVRHRKRRGSRPTARVPVCIVLQQNLRESTYRV